MLEKGGVDKTRYVHYSCACPTGWGSNGRSPVFFSESFLPAIHTPTAFCDGGGSLSLLFEADGFGFT